MELYILASDFIRDELVDDYESFIWTERFNEIGDFRLVVKSTITNRKKFSTGTILNHSDTNCVMVVETTDDVTDNEGRSSLTVTGRSLATIFENRLARDTLSDLTSNPKWILTGLPADIARQMVDDICNTGVLDAGDIVPFYSESSGWIYPADTIPEPPDAVVYEVEPQTLYTALKTLCDIYNMGFRIYREWEFGSPLTFGIYMGADRTTQQTTLPAVVFSPSLDNLQNTSELTSIGSYKNVAYVISPVGSEIVYALDVDPTVESFQRRVLFVRADDIQDTVPLDATNRMIQRGLDELAKHKAFSGFDGQLNQNAGYRYGGGPEIDPSDLTLLIYNLGDLVEFQSASGSSSVMQVTEQIFVSDAQGQRSYPTLTTRSIVVPGSWDSSTPDLVWDDVAPLLVWDAATEV